MQNLSRIFTPIPVLSASAWILRQRSSWFNVPIFSMLSPVVDVESRSGRGSSLVVSRPSLNVFNHPKTCVCDEHSFPYRYTALTWHMPPWQIYLIWVSPLLHLTTGHVTGSDISAIDCYNQPERPAGLSSKLRVGKASPNTVMFKNCTARSLFARSSISPVI